MTELPDRSFTLPPSDKFIEGIVKRLRKIDDDVETAIGARQYPETFLLLLAQSHISQGISILVRVMNLVRMNADKIDAADLPSRPAPQPPDAGSRFADRRAFPRFSFDAYAELTEPIAKLRRVGRVTEISQAGCFFELSDAPPANLIVELRVEKEGESFSTWARVMYTRPSGVGIRFMDTTADQMEVLLAWLGEGHS